MGTYTTADGVSVEVELVTEDVVNEDGTIEVAAGNFRVEWPEGVRYVAPAALDTDYVEEG